MWLVSLGAKAKLQQVMMTVAQKVPFELVALDGPASGFADSFETAAALAAAIEGIAGLGSQPAAAVRRVGIGVARRGLHDADGGGAAGDHGAVPGRGPDRGPRRRQLRGAGAGGRRAAPGVGVQRRLRRCSGWATGNLPEPRNNPQVGMANMRTVMPALQRAKAAPVASTGLAFASVTLPKQQRQTRIVKDMPAEEIAREIVAWMGEE